MKIKITILILVEFLVNAVIVNLPLLNAPTFDFSFVNSLVGFLLGGALVITLRNKEEKLNIKSYSVYSTLIIVIPLIVSIAANLLTDNCPIKEGLFFYFLMVVPSVILGSIISNSICNLFEKRRLILFVLTYLGLISSAVAEFYFYPQVYLYNSVFGYFPGTIYDEGLRVSSGLIIYRVLNLLAVIPLYYLSKFGVRKVRLGASIIYSILILFVFTIIKPELNLTTTFNKLEHKLNNRIETEHFIIYAPGNLSSMKLKTISLEHEFYFNKLKEKFGYKGKKIKSFLFKNDIEKGRLFGAKNADVAKPWLNSIFISLGSYHSTLKHELAHVFAGNFSSNFLRIADGYNFAMIEGFAVMADDDFDGYDLYDAANMAYSSGFKLSPVAIFNPYNFYKNNSSLSYLFAGAFLKYVGEKYGEKKITGLYRELDFKKQTGKSLDELSKEFEQFINSRKTVLNKNRAKLYFSRKSIIKKVCPREISNSYSEAIELLKDGNLEEAFNLLSESFKKSHDFKHFNGMIEILKKEKKYTDAIELCDKYDTVYDSSAYRYSFYSRFTDLAYITGRFSKADSILYLIENEKPGEVYVNFVNVRRALVNNSLALLSKYITGNNTDKYLILSGLLEQTKNYKLLPTLIYLAEELNLDYELFMKKNVEKISIEKIRYANILYLLGRYAKENFDYRKSLKFLNFAKLNCKEKRMERKISRETELVSWFIDKL